MVRRADAPPPGWYPDPTGGSGLRWWDGLDWTRHRRPPPSTLDTDAVRATRSGAGDSAGGGGTAASVPSATQLRSRGAERTREAAQSTEQQIATAAAEARRVAKAEVEKAVKDARQQLDATRDRWLPRLDDYRRRVRRWARVGAVAVVLFVVISAWMSATLQVGLLEWLGQRIDAATATVVLDGRSTHGAASWLLPDPTLR